MKLGIIIYILYYIHTHNSHARAKDIAFIDDSWYIYNVHMHLYLDYNIILQLFSSLSFGFFFLLQFSSHLSGRLCRRCLRG